MPRSFAKRELRFTLTSLVLLFSLAVVLLAGCEAKPAEVKKPTEKPAEKAAEAPSVLPPVEKDFEDCTYCHGSIDYGRVKEKVFGRKLLIFTHVPHINMGTKCSVCHKLPVHTKEKVNRPPMLVCYSADCHGLSEKSKAPGECAACHPKGFELKPKAHLVKNFLPPLHAQRAKEDKAYCDMCHQSKFCLDCHGLEMPHLAAFAKKHSALARKIPGKCSLCHREPDFCTACHHKGQGYRADMPWPKKGHAIVVGSKGADSCFKCHGPTYCDYCHVRGKPYPNIKGPHK